ncbi:MAG: histidine phosphatase family protein [Anaerolineae bacterium]|nr:histidine phosphatase family protein [Anaerolineae bacterium]
MKTLLLMRHAKSSWKEKGVEDHERPLNKRGQKDAPMMGNLLFEKELVPQRILCSSALRARLTAELLAETSRFVGEITYLNSFYLAEPGAYLEGLLALSDNLERIMIIGHNPGLEGLLQILSHQVESLPTAAIAHIALPVKSWADLNDETSGELIDLWRPRDLKHKHKK